jgi:D-aspartate ligase
MPARTILVTDGLRDTGVSTAGQLAAAGFDVLTTDCGELPFQWHSRFASRHFALASTSARHFQSAFLRLIRTHRPDVLLPMGTRFTYATILCRPHIPATTAVLVPTLEAFSAAFHKRQCMDECRALGIPHPRVYTLAEALHSLAGARSPHPLVVKPDLDLGAARGVTYIYDRESLQRAVTACTSTYGGALIQEYIPGGAAAMKTVTLLFSPDSRLIAAFTLQKLRQFPSEGGVTALARSTDDEHLVHQVLPFFQKWRWRGSAEVELKYDARDHVHKIIEINPRYPGYLRFTGQCGLNLPAIAVSLALHNHAVDALPFPAYEPGVGYWSPGIVAEGLLTALRNREPAIASIQSLATSLCFARPRFRGSVIDPLPSLGRVLDRLGCFRRSPSTTLDATWPLSDLSLIS